MTIFVAVRVALDARADEFVAVCARARFLKAMDGKVVERLRGLLALYDSDAVGRGLRPNRPHVNDAE